METEQKEDTRAVCFSDSVKCKEKKEKEKKTDKKSFGAKLFQNLVLEVRSKVYGKKTFNMPGK